MARRYTENGKSYYFSTEAFIRAYNDLYLESVDKNGIRNKDDFIEFFASKAGYSVDAIHNWLKGKGTPSGIDNVKRIADIFSVEYHKLLSNYESADFSSFRKLARGDRKIMNSKMKEMGIQARIVFEKISYMLWNDISVDIETIKSGAEGKYDAIMVLDGKLPLCGLKQESIEDEMKLLSIIEDIVTEDVLEFYFEEYPMLTGSRRAILVPSDIDWPELEDGWWKREGYEERMKKYNEAMDAVKDKALTDDTNYSLSLWREEAF